MKFSLKDFFNKCDWKLRIWSHLLKKSLMENFVSCAVIAQGLIRALLNNNRGSSCKNNDFYSLTIFAERFNINPFSTNVPLLNSLKTSENLRFSHVFRGFKSGTLVGNGLMFKRVLNTPLILKIVFSTLCDTVVLQLMVTS